MQKARWYLNMLIDEVSDDDGDERQAKVKKGFTAEDMLAESSRFFESIGEEEL